MNTHNIISTPDITGNIGSCTSKAEKVITYSGWIKNYGETIVTNSCTGKVEKLPYESLVLFPWVILFVCIIFLTFVVVGSWAERNSL